MKIFKSSYTRLSSLMMIAPLNAETDLELVDNTIRGRYRWESLLTAASI
jgi:hypothetical protein